MKRTLTLALTMLLSTSAWASELWMEIDIQSKTDKQTVHLEMPFSWMSDVHVDLHDAKLDAAELDRLAKELPVGQRKQVLEATDDDGTVTAALAHRKDSKSPPAKHFFVRGTGGANGEMNLTIPLGLLGAMGSMAGNVGGPSELEMTEVFAKLQGRGPFLLATIDGPDGHIEIGTE